MVTQIQQIQQAPQPTRFISRWPFERYFAWQQPRPDRTGELARLYFSHPNHTCCCTNALSILVDLYAFSQEAMTEGDLEILMDLEAEYKKARRALRRDAVALHN